MSALETWTLESIIAVGGMAEVWCARRGSEIVALKRLHSHLARNPELRDQFVTEQQLARALPRHPHLVHAVDAGKLDELPYVALELAPGEDLRRYLAPPVKHERSDARAAVARPVLSRTQRIAIAIAACEAAAHLHAHGYVHGDINPGNLVVEPAQRGVVLVDLGIARSIQRGAGGAVRGTHAYMAPEQVKAGAWTPATDVFALGVVLWELIAGARLFHRGPTWLSMAAVVEDAAPPLADPELDAIAQAALEKDPARRTASARALAAQLSDQLNLS